MLSLLTPPTIKVFAFQFSGFGITENKTFSYELRSARLEIQSDDTCVTFSPKLYKSLLNEFTFCAGYGPQNGILFYFKAMTMPPFFNTKL